MKVSCLRFGAWLVGLLILCSALSAQTNTPDISQPPAALQAFSKGTYYDRLATLACPEDEGHYGSYYEEEYQAALTGYCGQGPTPAGYWVYQAPHWHIYKYFLPLPPAVRASLGGKYQNLKGIYACPSSEAAENQSLGRFYDAGWEDASDYCGEEVPAGYWVWLSPHWYLWETKDIKAIGFEQLTDQVQLKNQNLKLIFEFHHSHRTWAQSSLARLKRGLVAMEALSALPYPGDNPYLIEEHPNFSVLGMAGQDKMALSSPPRGSPWTLLHEMVHIWNVNVTPAWVNEGHANFISYLLMKKLNYPFIGEETLPLYLAHWEESLLAGEDLPLQQHYHELPAGKAMAFWKMLYELEGPDLLAYLFRQSVKTEAVSLKQLKSWLKAKSHLNPDQLLSGWVVKGPYKLRSAKDLGIKYPLP